MLEFENHCKNTVRVIRENHVIALIILIDGLWTFEVDEEDCTLNLGSSELRQIADKLDELNNIKVRLV